MADGDIVLDGMPTQSGKLVLRRVSDVAPAEGGGETERVRVMPRGDLYCLACGCLQTAVQWYCPACGHKFVRETVMYGGPS